MLRYWFRFPFCFCVLLLCGLAYGVPLAGAAEPQEPFVSEAGWSNLGQVQAGERIEVRTQAGIASSGTFLSFSNEAIRLREGDREVSCRREEVLQVLAFGPPKRRKAALIGLVVGFAAGAGVASAAASSGRDFAHPVGLGAVAGGIGVVVGALVAPRPRKVIYLSRDSP